MWKVTSSHCSPRIPLASSGSLLFIFAAISFPRKVWTRLRLAVFCVLSGHRLCQTLCGAELFNVHVSRFCRNGGWFTYCPNTTRMVRNLYYFRIRWRNTIVGRTHRAPIAHPPVLLRDWAVFFSLVVELPSPCLSRQSLRMPLSALWLNLSTGRPRQPCQLHHLKTRLSYSPPPISAKMIISGPSDWRPGGIKSNHF